MCSMPHNQKHQVPFALANRREHKMMGRPGLAEEAVGGAFQQVGGGSMHAGRPGAGQGRAGQPEEGEVKPVEGPAETCWSSARFEF